MTAPRILVIGSVNMDLVTRLERTPRPGETVRGRSFVTVCGGKGANQAVAAARLGARTWLAGRVGDDAFGQRQRAALDAEGVDLSCLKTVAGTSTGTAVILVADDGQNAIVITSGANATLTGDDVAALDLLFREGLDAMLVQFEIPDEAVAAALALARRHGVLSVLDVGVARDVPRAMLAAADIVSPNESEAEAMTGCTIAGVDDARRAARVLLEKGAREVVLKLGRHGSLYAGESMAHVRAFDIEVRDTTAAGDAFTAALATVWRRLPPAEALRFANAAGALAASREGAQPSMPTRAEVEAFLSAR